MTKQLDNASAEIERIADAIWNAEYLVITAGPEFDEASSNPFESDFCASSLVSKPNRFMGFWGAFYNEYTDRNLHDGYAVLARWRDRLFSADDIRRRGKKKASAEDDDVDKMLRFMVYTGHVGNSYQRAGIPQEEMMEVCGNLTLWQCGMNPVCTPKVFGVDRGFRFFIDPLTKEALPIKYVPPKPLPALKVHDAGLVDSDDDEARFRASDGIEGLLKLSSEERQRRQQRIKQHARAIRITPFSQFAGGRFPDLFCGFASTSPGTVESYTFDTAKPALRPRTDSHAVVEKPQDGAPVPPPRRVSHLLAHVDAIDRKTLPDRVGVCYTADPDRWRKERDGVLHATARAAMADCPTIAAKREKFVSYNISVIMTSVAKPAVLPDDVRSALLYPYAPDERFAEEQAIHDLTDRHMTEWSQGTNNWFYFSHVPIRNTVQEPVGNGYLDVVHVPFPSPDEERHLLPQGGVISVVCETVINTAVDHEVPAKAKHHPKLEAGENPFICTTNVWQLVGTMEDIKTAAGEASAKVPAGVRPTIEYVLQGRKGHLLKVGVSRSAPHLIQYMNLEIPIRDFDAPPFVTSLSKPIASVAFSAELLQSSILQKRAEENAAKSQQDSELVPAPNHILCRYCREIARPHVLMNAAGRKDDGFATVVLQQRQKLFKIWEKAIVDGLKQDQNRSLVLLEIGTSRKPDPAKAYSEKTYKLLKTAKCTYVRLARDIAEAKAKGGPSADNANAISIQGHPVSALQAIDRAINERIRKLGKV